MKILLVPDSWVMPNGCVRVLVNSRIHHRKARRPRGKRDVLRERLLEQALNALAAAAARIVEDDAKPTLLHMRELNRRRSAAARLLTTDH